MAVHRFVPSMVLQGVSPPLKVSADYIDHDGEVWMASSRSQDFVPPRQPNPRRGCRPSSRRHGVSILRDRVQRTWHVIDFSSLRRLSLVLGSVRWDSCANLALLFLADGLMYSFPQLRNILLRSPRLEEFSLYVPVIMSKFRKTSYIFPICDTWLCQPTRKSFPFY